MAKRKRKVKVSEAIKSVATSPNYGQQFCQVGMLVMIKAKPPKGKKNGFKVGMELEIEEPTKDHLNTLMGVFVKSPTTGKKVYLQFPYVQYLVKTNEKKAKKNKKKK